MILKLRERGRNFLTDWLSCCEFIIGCGPCKAIAPTFEALARSNQNVVFLKVDVDQNQQIAQKYGVRAMPTFLFLRKSATLDTLKGANGSKLTSLVQQYSKTGSGMSGFPGGGQTIGGRSNIAAQQAGQPGGLIGLISQVPKENMLPFVVILGYLAYVIFGRG